MILLFTIYLFIIQMSLKTICNLSLIIVDLSLLAARPEAIFLELVYGGMIPTHGTGRILTEVKACELHAESIESKQCIGEQLARTCDILDGLGCLQGSADSSNRS